MSSPSDCIISPQPCSCDVTCPTFKLVYSIYFYFCYFQKWRSKPEPVSVLPSQHVTEVTAALVLGMWVLPLLLLLLCLLLLLNVSHTVLLWDICGVQECRSRSKSLRHLKELLGLLYLQRVALRLILGVVGCVRLVCDETVVRDHHRRRKNRRGHQNCVTVHLLHGE